jgi:hypothetical protein
MEMVRFKPENSRNGPAAIADVASVDLDVARLFERFRRDLDQMFGHEPKPLQKRPPAAKDV